MPHQLGFVFVDGVSPVDDVNPELGLRLQTRCSTSERTFKQ
jgi:hypothetical protein